MHFVSDAIAEIGGLLVVNRDFCKQQMMQKAPLVPPPNESALPWIHLAKTEGVAALRRGFCRAEMAEIPPPGVAGFIQ